MKKLFIALVALMAIAAPAHAEAPLHPVAVSQGGAIVGSDTECSTQLSVKLFAHYIDTNGLVGNQIMTTATSTCAGATLPTQDTVVRLFNANGTEIGTPLGCASAVTCTRYDWVWGPQGTRVYGAGAALWKLPSGTAAWVRCVDLNPPGGVVQAGYCSIRSDTKWAAISAYADHYLT